MCALIIDSKLYKPSPEKPKRKMPKHKFNIIFSSKAFDYIKLPGILRSQTSICKLPPNSVLENEIPMEVYRLTDQIRSKVLNYSKFVSKLNIEQAAADVEEAVECNSRKYHPKFVNDHHQHILTGDLSIIKSEKLCDLFYKGPKYREPQTIDFDIARSSIEENLDTFTETISKKKGLLVNNFIAWKNHILSEVDSRISTTKTKFRFTVKRSIFHNPKVKDVLRCLQEPLRSGIK